MNQDDRTALLTQGRRNQAAGHYAEAIADYLAANELSLEAPLRLWRQRSFAEPNAIIPLIRAMRELEIARTAIDEYLRAIDRPPSSYRGFTLIDAGGVSKLARTSAVAQICLRRSGPMRRREDLEMLLDIAEDEATDPRHGPTLLAYPHLRPIHPRLHLITARQLLATSRYQAARYHLEEAIRLAPCYGPAYRLLGEALVGLGHGTAAARCFDCAAAFWNPDWWVIEFPRGTQMRVPGLVIRGHDIFFWEDTFLAVKISLRRRRLRLFALAELRRLYNLYRSYRAHSRQKHSDWPLLPLGAFVYRAIASAVLRLPGALWVWLQLRPVVWRAMAQLRRLGRSLTNGASESLRGGLPRLRSAVKAWLGCLFPGRSPTGPTSRNRWRTRFALWVARVEVMWGATSTLHAASLYEMLELLERVDT